MSKIAIAQSAQEFAERAWEGYKSRIPNGSLTKKDFYDAWFSGQNSSKWKEVDNTVRNESAAALRGGVYQQYPSKLTEPTSVSEVPGKAEFSLNSPNTSQAPATSAGNAIVLQTSLNALHNLAKGLPGYIDDSYADAPKIRAALTDLTTPLRNYAFNSAPIKMTGKLDADTRKQYDLVKRLKTELSNTTPLSLWGDKARDMIATLRGNMAGVAGLKNAANDIMEEVDPATVEEAAAAINRTANNIQNAFGTFINLPNIELEETSESKPKPELTEKARRWAQWLARERVNAAIAKRNLSPTDAAAMRMSDRARKAITNEYHRIADILRDPSKAKELVGSVDDTKEERQAKIDYYKTTGRLATAHVDFDNLTKFADKFYELVES